VSLIISALAVPALVRVKDVGVDRPEAKVNPIFRASVVVIVLPPLYADCKVMEAAEQATKLLLVSKHRVEPVAVCKPLKITVELASVVKVTSLVESGSITTGPLAVKVCPEAMVAPPLKVANPEPAKV